MFVDNIRIHAHAGNGGDGSAHFYRGKFNPNGGPDGGDGGKGGDIIVRVDSNTSNLKAFFFNPKVKAQHGGNGTGRQCFGKSAPDLIITVPPGTLIYHDTSWSAEAPNPTDPAPLDFVAPEGGDYVFDNEAEDEDIFEPGSAGDAAAEAASRKRTLKQRLDEGVELELVADLTEWLGMGRTTFAYGLMGLFLGYLYFSLPRAIATYTAAASAITPNPPPTALPRNSLLGSKARKACSTLNCVKSRMPV